MAVGHSVVAARQAALVVPQGRRPVVAQPYAAREEQLALEAASRLHGRWQHEVGRLLTGESDTCRVVATLRGRFRMWGFAPLLVQCSIAPLRRIGAQSDPL